MVRALLAYSCGSSALQAAEIRWSGSEECRRESEVREQIESMTQRPLAGVASDDFELELQTLESGGFRLQLVSISRAGGSRETRVMQGATCAEVTDAAAVAIALAIGAAPDAPAAPLLRPSDALPIARPPAAGTTERRKTPSPPPASPERARWLVGLGATADSAVAPHAVPGLELHGGVAWRALRGELQAGAFAPSTKQNERGQGGTFQLLYLAPRVCATARVGTPRAAACLAYELGRLNAEGEGVERPYSRGTFWNAVRPELELAWPLTRELWLSGRGGAAIALVRDRFVLDGPAIVHRPGWLSLRAAVGFELEL
jgi:hypothetical protein